MPAPAPADTNELLAAVAQGDRSARSRLLSRHRHRLRRMVAVRLDRRLSARVDPSDVVQDALADADRRLDGYVRERPIPFYPWLRRLAWDRVTDAYRRHCRSGRRTIDREEPPLPDASGLRLAEKLIAKSADQPAARLLSDEQRGRVRDALGRLRERDREVLVLRHLEDLSTAETAAVIGMTEGAVKVRLLRALQRLRELLDEEAAS